MYIELARIPVSANRTPVGVVDAERLRDHEPVGGRVSQYETIATPVQTGNKLYTARLGIAVP